MVFSPHFLHFTVRNSETRLILVLTQDFICGALLEGESSEGRLGDFRPEIDKSQSQIFKSDITGTLNIRSNAKPGVPGEFYWKVWHPKPTLMIRSFAHPTHPLPWKTVLKGSDLMISSEIDFWTHQDPLPKGIGISTVVWQYSSITHTLVLYPKNMRVKNKIPQFVE